MSENSDSKYSSIVILESLWYHNFTLRGQNSQEIVTIISVPRKLELNWNKVHNFLQSLSTPDKVVVSNLFQHENGGIHGIWAFWYFSSKIGRQKYSDWVSGDPFYVYEG